MYWYYKLPLVALAVIAGLGLLYLVWKQFPASPAESAAAVPPGTVQTATDAPMPDAGPAGSVPRAVPGSAPGGPAPTTAAPPETARRLVAAEEQLRKENLLAARTLARQVLRDPGVAMFSPTWRRAADVVSSVSTILFNSDAPAPEKQAYVVQSGDTLVQIAYRLRTTVGALQRINRLDPTNSTIHPGNVLHHHPGDWSIHVSKEHFALLVMNGEELFKLYPVGIGRQDRTPVGVFEINSKISEPAWTPPGKNIPYGHPDNVLGTRWLGVIPIEDTDPTLRGYGIHGTWEPDSIGTAASQGCVRMRNADVEELFDIIPHPDRATVRQGKAIRVTIKDN